jgi:uncharacterized protein YjbI with pentapeptide repeats
MSRNVSRALTWALAAVVAAGLLVLAIWVVPWLVTRNGLAGAAQLKAENDVRTPVVAALAVVGAAALTAGVTWRTTKTAQETQRLSELARITDLYTKAIDQLGNDHLAVQTGGIYALERIARDAPKDNQATVMEVLATFVRGVSNLQWSSSPKPDETQTTRTTPLAVQAALTVIGRRNPACDVLPIDLSGAKVPQADLTHSKLMRADLSGAWLAGANLTGAVLQHANLTGAVLQCANLTEADLQRANLTDTDLTGGAALKHANLTEAVLQSANLTGAGLFSANLTRAELDGANLSGADLTEADLDSAHLTRSTNLSGANLQRADLTSADLTNADFTGAYLGGALWPPDERAPAPRGWARDPSSGKLRRARADA